MRRKAGYFEDEHGTPHYAKEGDEMAKLELTRLWQDRRERWASHAEES